MSRLLELNSYAARSARLGKTLSCTAYVMQWLSCSGASWDPNIEIPDSIYTVIMRVHHGLTWSEDLRLSVRAMMTECRHAGLHFWLLH